MQQSTMVIFMASIRQCVLEYVIYRSLASEAAGVCVSVCPLTVFSTFPDLSVMGDYTHISPSPFPPGHRRS